ncbi:MAG: glycosyltransferase [Caulobacter sp.]|nr:glycosyltransferase [Caulobacter sp.]
MRVIQVVASVTDEAAGPSYSVPRLSASVARAGASVDLFTIGPARDVASDGVVQTSFAQDLAQVPGAKRLWLSSEMRRSLFHEARHAEILHMHGLWLMPNIYPADAARAARKPLVISPRGMLGAPALRFSPLKKRAFWRVLQERAALSASLMHATSEAEFEDIRAYGLTNPVAIIPNGVDLPPVSGVTRRRSRTVLSLGRIHPKKGLDTLVRAWARLGGRAEGWRLRIVGPSEVGHAEKLRGLASDLNLATVDIEGPLFGDDKLAAYRQADLFVLPTQHENFAMTVAEALAAQLPVISSKGAPWSGLERERCGWWIDHGDEPLAAALAHALALPIDELAAMGNRGRDWMEREYSWNRVGREMFEAYRWLVLKGPPPSTVRL